MLWHTSHSIIISIYLLNYWGSYFNSSNSNHQLLELKKKMGWGKGEGKEGLKQGRSPLDSMEDTSR